MWLCGEHQEALAGTGLELDVVSGSEEDLFSSDDDWRPCEAPAPRRAA